MTVKSVSTNKEKFISDDTKERLIDLSTTLLQGMVMAAGSLIVNSAAQRYQNKRQRKLISKSSNVVDFQDRAVNT